MLCCKLSAILTHCYPVDNGTSNGRPYEVCFKSCFVTNRRPGDVPGTYQMIPNKSVSFGLVPDVQQRCNIDSKDFT